MLVGRAGRVRCRVVVALAVLTRGRGGWRCFWAAVALVLQATHEWQALRIAPGSNDTRLLLEGVVVSVPARVGAEWRFDADVQPIAGHSDGRPRRARLAWRGAPVAPRVGERWRWLVRLSRASESRNFSGIDLERVAFRDRVHLTGRDSASGDQPAACTGALVGRYVARAHRRANFRQRSRSGCGRIAHGAGSGRHIGHERGSVARFQCHRHHAPGGDFRTARDAVRVAGADRGARVVALFTRARRVVDREPFAILLALAAAGGYSLLAGFSVPTQRTWLMLAIFALARLGARHVGAGRTWSLALAAVLLLDVFAPLAAGFWLSFIAVGVILAIEASALTPETRTRRFAARAIRRDPGARAADLRGFRRRIPRGPGSELPGDSHRFFRVRPAGALPARSRRWRFRRMRRVVLARGPLYEWLWPALVWAADLELAQWRAVPPAWWFALAVPASVLLLWRWPWPLRLTAVVTAVVAAVRAVAPAAGRHGAGHRIRRRARGRGAHRHSHARAAVRYRRCLEHTRHTHGAQRVSGAGCARSPPGRRAGAADTQRRSRARCCVVSHRAGRGPDRRRWWLAGRLVARVALRENGTSNGTAWSSTCWRPAGEADSVCCACRWADMCCSPAETWTSPPSANCWHACRRGHWRATSRYWDGRRVRGFEPKVDRSQRRGPERRASQSPPAELRAATRVRARCMRWRDAGTRVFDTQRDGAIEFGFGTGRCHEHHRRAFRALAVCLAARRVTLSAGAPV